MNYEQSLRRRMLSAGAEIPVRRLSPEAILHRRRSPRAIGALVLAGMIFVGVAVFTVQGEPRIKPAGGDPADSFAAVESFLEAAAAGNADVVWSLLSDRARESWGTFDEFTAGFGTIANRFERWLDPSTINSITLHERESFVGKSSVARVVTLLGEGAEGSDRVWAADTVPTLTDSSTGETEIDLMRASGVSVEWTRPDTGICIEGSSAPDHVTVCRDSANSFPRIVNGSRLWARVDEGDVSRVMFSLGGGEALGDGRFASSWWAFADPSMTTVDYGGGLVVTAKFPGAPTSAWNALTVTVIMEDGSTTSTGVPVFYTQGSR